MTCEEAGKRDAQLRDISVYSDTQTMRMIKFSENDLFIIIINILKN